MYVCSPGFCDTDMTKGFQGLVHAAWGEPSTPEQGAAVVTKLLFEICSDGKVNPEFQGKMWNIKQEIEEHFSVPKVNFPEGFLK